MMKSKSYGVSKKQLLSSDLDGYLEEISILGYTILENVIDHTELAEIRVKLYEVYSVQETELGKEYLHSIQETDIARCPLAYDQFFLKLPTNPRVLEIIKALLGEYFVLHLQNGIINRPNLEIHQSSWHRDLPYQDFIISRPLAISALFCIDDFNEKTGGTLVLPYSHKLEQQPSETFLDKNSVNLVAKAGSVIMFDSMLYHRAGYNSSDHIRRGINHVFVAGILKQQINIPKMLDGHFKEDPFLHMLLGYDSEVSENVAEFRKRRHKKTKDN